MSIRTLARSSPPARASLSAQRSRRWMMVVIGWFGLVLPCAAQAPNLAVYQQLAQRCLAEVPDTLAAFRLDAPEAMPYLRTALVEGWQPRHAVYAADTTAPPLPRLQYHVEDATVRYTRAAGKRLGREVALTLRYTLTAPDGRILREQRCRETHADTVERAALAALEGPFDETQGVVPPAGWLRRYLEPAVVTAATALGIYLFFSLRSRSSGGA